MRALLIIAIIIILQTNILSQNYEEVHVPAQYETVQIKYFILDEVESAEIELEKEDLSKILINTYIENGLYNLTNTPIEDWPNEAIEHPKIILNSKVSIKGIGYPFSCAKITIEHIDYRKNQLSKKSIKPKKKHKKKFNNCTEHIAFEFNKWLNEIKYASSNFKYSIEKTEAYVTYRNSGKGAILKFQNEIPITNYTLSDINNYFETNKNYKEFEGIYRFEDLEKGCTYEFVILESNQNLNIVWMNSEVEKWKIGYLKGRILKNKIQSKNEAIWIDKNGRRRRVLISQKSNGSVEVFYTTDRSTEYTKVNEI